MKCFCKCKKEKEIIYVNSINFLLYLNCILLLQKNYIEEKIKMYHIFMVLLSE